MAHGGIYKVGRESSEVGLRVLTCVDGCHVCMILYLCECITEIGLSAWHCSYLGPVAGKRMLAISTAVHTIVSRTCACMAL